jgi:hypothetical protein
MGQGIFCGFRLDEKQFRQIIQDVMDNLGRVWGCKDQYMVRCGGHGHSFAGVKVKSGQARLRFYPKPGFQFP